MNKALHCVTLLRIGKENFIDQLASGPQQSLLSLCFSLIIWGAVGRVSSAFWLSCPSTKSWYSSLHKNSTVQPSSPTLNISVRWWCIHLQPPQRIPAVHHLGLSLLSELNSHLDISSLLHFTMASTSCLTSRILLAPPATSVSLFSPPSIIASLLLLLSEGCQLHPPVRIFLHVLLSCLLMLHMQSFT